MLNHNKNKVHVCIDRLSELDRQRLRRRYERRNEDTDGTGLNAFHIALLTAKRWEIGRTLRCRFLDGPSSVQERVVAKAQKWSQHANINFEFVTSGSAEIRISFIADDGSWSYLGNDALGIPASEPTMNFGWLDVGTPDAEYERVVLHEFGHALGCIHEHQNPDGNIRWDRQAVIDYYTKSPNNWSLEDIEVNLFYRYGKEVTTRTQLDPRSIMMYAIPADHLLPGSTPVPGGDTLTQSDIDFIKRTYPRSTPTPTVLPLGGAPLPARIGAAREIDEYRFTVQQAGRYRVSTEGPTDVFMTLLGPNNTAKFVDDDDDSGPGLNPLVEAQLTPGTYTVRVRHFDPQKVGDYKIRVAKV